MRILRFVFLREIAINNLPLKLLKVLSSCLRCMCKCEHLILIKSVFSFVIKKLSSKCQLSFIFYDVSHVE